METFRLKGYGYHSPIYLVPPRTGDAEGSAWYCAGSIMNGCGFPTAAGLSSAAEGGRDNTRALAVLCREAEEGDGDGLGGKMSL